MLTKTYELKDKRYIGVSVLEVLSFPNVPDVLSEKEKACANISKCFKQATSELHKLGGSTAAYEMLWVTEKVANQLFNSFVRIFFVIRKIGANKAAIKSDVERLQEHFLSVLSSRQYAAKEIDVDKLINIVDGIDLAYRCGIVKTERYAANSTSVYPYYFTDIIPGNNYENFESLIAAMSETGNAAISFQLFPTALSDSERAIINELTNELLQFSTGTVINNGRVYKDVAAIEPSKFYTYYNERKAYPVYLYNLLVFGSSETCKRLSSKLISFLQSGTDKVNSAEFACVDLTNEKVDLVKSFPNYVWNINAKLQYQYRDLRYQKVIPFAAYLKRMPYLLSLDEAATFFKLPLYEESMFALKNGAIYQTHEQFADEVVDGSGIVFGEATANGAKVSVGCPESYFAKHAMIVGSPGSGKTTFSVGLLLQFYKKKIPFLAIEPTKSEYRAMIDVIPELQIFTPGKNDVSPFILNPFIPPRGIRVEQYIPSLASAFKAAFSMPNPLDIAFLKSIKECYLQYGWKDYSMVGDKGTRVFGLYEFILFFKEQIKNIYSDPTVRGRMESAGVLRLSNLIEQNSNIYDTVNSISIEDMLTKPTVLELNAIDNSEQKALLMALILIMVCVYTYNHQAGDGELKNILLIDEAHVLLGNNRNVLNSENKADSEGATVRALEDMIAAIRSYGTGIIIADQSAVSIGRRIVANTDIKVAFRLVESAEKEIIADSSNMGAKEKEQLSRLESGEAFVYHHKLSTAQVIRSEDIRKENNIRLVVSDQEIAKRMTYWSTRKALLRPYHECELCKSCVYDCDFILRSDADYIAAKALRKYRKGIVDDVTLKKCLFHLPKLMNEDFDGYSVEKYFRLIDCTRIRLFRKSLMELSVAASHNVLTDVIGRYPKDITEKNEQKGDRVIMCDFDGEYGAAPDVNENFEINDGGERIIDAAADSEIEILDVDTVSEDWGDDTAILDISDESVDVAPNEDAVSEAFFDSFSLDELDDSHYRASSLSKEEVQQIDDLWKEDSKSTDVEPYQAERISEDGVAKIEEFSKDEALDTEPYHAISNNLDVAAESDADHFSDEIKALSLDEIEARQEHLVKLENNAEADIFKEYDANVKGSLTEEQYHDLVDGLPKEALEHLRDGLKNRDKDVLDYFGLSTDDGNSDHPKELVLKRM